MYPPLWPIYEIIVSNQYHAFFTCRCIPWNFRDYRNVANHMVLFHFHCPRWFRGQVVEYPVYVINFVGDPVHHLLQDLPRDIHRSGCHEVRRLNGSQDYGVIVGSEVTHYPYGTDVCKGCKVLGRLPLRLLSAVGLSVLCCSLVHLFTVDGICLLDDLDLFRR